ncbi:MAG TPA: Ig-like domain-containing protein, partial [Vicinamibacterales bacterium]|nr:Ig-like domain-containing protein [Vicinamibacterales bacterium]
MSGTSPTVGGTAQFTATAALSDTSSKPVTSDATWQSSNAAVATVNAGMVTGVSAGDADITATYQNVTGKLHVTITTASGPPTVAAVSLAGAAPAIGATTQFSALAAFSNNTTQEVTNVAAWRSSNTAVATVNSGQVRGVAAGDADISATYQGVTGTLHITIGTSSSTSPTAPAPTVTLVTISGNT